MEGQFKLYRCLRSSRLIDGEREHDECADIISRNPGVDFRPGLAGVEVEHKIYAHTLWDPDFENYPRRYLEDYKGRLGHIIVSCGSQSGFDEWLRNWHNTPGFYQPDWMEHRKGRNFFIAANTVIVRVRVERVIDRL